MSKLVLLPLLLVCFTTMIVKQCHASSHTASDHEEEKPTPDLETAFTPKQLDRARQQLAAMFDTGLDADKDGQLTLGELTEWLARSSAEQADADLDNSWRGFNLTGETPSLDWDTYVARSMAGRQAASSDADSKAALSDADSQAAREAAVRQAILEASQESGLEKAGLRVSMPEIPHQKEDETKKDKDAEQQHQKQEQQIAIELARDRRRWDAADADGDGRLSRLEFRDFALAESTSPRVRGVLALEALERMDSDGDGQVSEAEFLSAATEYTTGEKEKDTVASEEVKNFRELWDADKDGYLNANEVGSMFDHLDTPGAVTKDANELHEAEAKELLAAADANRDGSLSKEEVLAGVEGFAASRVTNYGDLVGIHDEL